MEEMIFPEKAAEPDSLGGRSVEECLLRADKGE